MPWRQVMMSGLDSERLVLAGAAQPAAAQAQELACGQSLYDKGRPPIPAARAVPFRQAAPAASWRRRWMWRCRTPRSASSSGSPSGSSRCGADDRWLLTESLAAGCHGLGARVRCAPALREPWKPPVPGPCARLRPQQVQAKLANMYARLKSCRSYMLAVAAEADAGGCDRKDCAAVILTAAEAGVQSALDAIQVRR
jgi:hypothetical protein